MTTNAHKKPKYGVNVGPDGLNLTQDYLEFEKNKHANLWNWLGIRKVKP